MIKVIDSKVKCVTQHRIRNDKGGSRVLRFGKVTDPVSNIYPAEKSEKKIGELEMTIYMRKTSFQDYTVNVESWHGLGIPDDLALREVIERMHARAAKETCQVDITHYEYLITGLLDRLADLEKKDEN